MKPHTQARGRPNASAASQAAESGADRAECLFCMPGRRAARTARALLPAFTATPTSTPAATLSRTATGAAAPRHGDACAVAVRASFVAPELDYPSPADRRPARRGRKSKSSGR